MARPNLGLAHVDRLPGGAEEKFRLKVVLATISGELLVEEACDELDVGPTQFANLRREALLGALEGLSPRPGGRPRKVPEVSLAEVQALRQRVAELERERELMRARLEVAMLPLLTRPKSASGAKGRVRRTPPAAGAAADPPS